MSEAERLAEDLHRQFMNDDTNFDTMIEASIELHRLSAIERELAALKASIGEPVAVHQYQLASGAWIDQDEDSNAYNVKHGQAKVRTLYALTKDKP